MNTNRIECRFHVAPLVDSQQEIDFIPHAILAHLKAHGVPATLPLVAVELGRTLRNLSYAIPDVSSGTLHWIYYNRAGYVDFTWTP